jgi:hypothetical protein
LPHDLFVSDDADFETRGIVALNQQADGPVFHRPQTFDADRPGSHFPRGCKEDSAEGDSPTASISKIRLPKEWAVRALRAHTTRRRTVSYGCSVGRTAADAVAALP